MAGPAHSQGKGDDPFARLVLDPLRAGLQVTGASILSLALVFSALPHAGDTGLWAWLGLNAASVIVIGARGYPTRTTSFRAFVGRALAASAWGSAFLVGGFVALVVSDARNFDDSMKWRAFLVVAGGALVALGIWPRRPVPVETPAPAASPSAFRDIAGALLVVAMVGVAAFGIAAFGIAARSDWMTMVPRLVRRAPDGVLVALGGAVGFALVVFVASVYWMTRARSARPWTLAILPAGVVAAVGLAMERIHTRPALAAAYATSRPFDERVTALSDAIDVAWPVWVSMLFVVAVLLAGSSLAVGLRARLRFDRAPTNKRPITGLVVGLVIVGALPIFGQALLRHDVGSSRLASSWIALLPASIGVVSVFLAAGRTALVGDAIVAAAFAALSVFAVAFGLGAGELAAMSDAVPGPDWKAEMILRYVPEQRQIVRVTLLALVPIFATVAVAIRPRQLRAGAAPGLPVVVAAAVTLGLGFAAIQVSMRTAMSALSTLWARELPAGVELPIASGGACDGLVVPEIVFIGAASITRGGREIAHASQLDTDAGCAALVLDLERAPKPSTELRLGFDPSTAYARVECLARALASSALRDEKAGKTVRRRPRCAVEVLTTANDGPEAAPFPQCTTLHLASDECIAPTAATPVVATASQLYIVEHGADVTAYAIGQGPANPRLWYGSDPLLLSGAPDARIADVVAIPDRMHSRDGFAASSLREVWLVPADVPSAAMLAMVAPPHFDATETATVSASAGDVEGIDRNAMRAALTAANERLAACQVFGAGPAAKRSGSASARILVGADGSVPRVWSGSSAGDARGPRVAACVSRVLSELRFPRPPAPTLVAVTMSVRLSAAKITIESINGHSDGFSPREVQAATVLRGAADGPLRACYEAGLRRPGARQGAMGGAIPVRLGVVGAKVVFAFADAPFDAEVAKCALDVIRKLPMPTDAAGDYELRLTIRMTPPADVR